MAESHEIHQIEYRWQPTTDMSAVASSMSPESFRSWVQRIGPWVRQPAVDAPTDSVRYEMFGDTAALAWRQRDRQTVEFQDGREGRPLASRVLLGPADLLTPDVAMAVCYAGLPSAIGPRPGAVIPGSTLSPLAAAGLTGLAQDNAGRLDQAAAQEAGLEQVIATALTDRDTPLAVQLPERMIVRSPRGSSQALLLWGLRRTVAPLLGQGRGRRGWSFSTFELPLSDMDPGSLPDIVFRLMQAATQAPAAVRKELRVRPQDPIPAPVDTAYQHLARLLVAAYRRRGGDELGQLISAWAGDLPSADRRIQAVHSALNDSLPGPATATREEPRNTPVQTPARTGPDDDTCVAGVVWPASVSPGRAGPDNAVHAGEATQAVTTAAVAPTAPPVPAETVWVTGTVETVGVRGTEGTEGTESTVGTGGGGATVGAGGAVAPSERRQPEPMSPPAASLSPQVPSRPFLTPEDSAVLSRPLLAPQPPEPPPVTSPAAGWPTMPPSRPPQHAPQPFEDEDQRGQAWEAPPPATLSALLALLSAGPDSPDFESVLQSLQAQDFQTGADDRAVARTRIREHGWYVGLFAPDDQGQLEDILVMIFWHTVVPDLTERHVLDELAHWAGRLTTPTAVIRALYATAEAAPGRSQLMDRALRPALAWRWLKENGIQPPAPEPAPALSSPSSRDLDAGSPPREAGSRHQRPAAAQEAGPAALLWWQRLLRRKMTVSQPLVLAMGLAIVGLVLFIVS